MLLPLAFGSLMASLGSSLHEKLEFLEDRQEAASSQEPGSRTCLMFLLAHSIDWSKPPASPQSSKWQEKLLILTEEVAMAPCKGIWV